ncbi:fimbria/pilus periplasmic chaperone [Aeromonas veronii]|uniref:fimbria/pilus periplasmic chaperone n=1 Tax=Aeromonas veronii TaxID=654 RepID=UPI0031FE1D70
MRFLQIIMCLISIACNTATHAVDIGSMTEVIEPNDRLITKSIINNADSPKVYQLSVIKIDNPKKNNAVLDGRRAEVLFTPRQFTLHPQEEKIVKLFYNGPSDNSERYFRVTISEKPAPRQQEFFNERKIASIDINLNVDIILVVRPKIMFFNYDFSASDSTIQNTGNTFFKVIVKKGCEQDDSDADSTYLLPGETYKNVKLKEFENDKVILFGHKYERISSKCLHQKSLAM